MPKPLSLDMRERIIEAKLRGDTEDVIADEKEVSKSTVTKLWALYKETGSYKPRPNPNGRKPALSQQDLDNITTKIAERPDITLQELIDELNLPVSVSALCRTVNDKLGLRFKKNAPRYRARARGCKSSAGCLEDGAIEHGNRQTGFP